MIYITGRMMLDSTKTYSKWRDMILKGMPEGTATEVFQDGIVACCDATTFLQSVPSESADVVFLDPPFNIGKVYSESGKTDELGEPDYREFLLSVLDHGIDILRPGGALYLYHLPNWAMEFGAYLSRRLDFRHWIAISMKNGFARGRKLYPAHYALLYFTKGEPSHFARPKIPPPRCRNCGEYIRDYGGYKKYVEQGINLSDIWDDVSPVRHKRYKNRTANELPVVIPSRVAKISGVPMGTWVDPFAGAGTTLLVARENGMAYAGCDNQKANFRLIIERLVAGQKGNQHVE